MMDFYVDSLDVFIMCVRPWSYGPLPIHLDRNLTLNLVCLRAIARGHYQGNAKR